ncbi:MAG: SDR family oxidoreductase [Candidatus Latescibacterota bacterium]
MSAGISTELKGQVVLVTGAGTGIGSAISLAAARAGADVAVCYQSSRKGALAVRRKVIACGRRAVVLKADIGNPGEVAALVGRVLSELGRVDVLVNNAATVIRAPFLDFALADWDQTFAVNLRGAFLLSQAAARSMNDGGIKGRIINISSVGGMIAHDSLCAYDAAKAGMNMLTRCAARELGPLGITVNAIVPGAIEVDRTKEEFADPARSDRWKRVIPVGRRGQPEEIARAVVFLASQDAGFINGQTLVIDGGQSVVLS